MTESRLICCCGAVTWARVIAWMQISFNILNSFLVVLAVYGVAVAIFEPDDKEADGDLKSISRMLVLLVFAWVFEIGSMGFGILLLIGTNEKRPSFLRAWIVYALFISVWTIVAAGAGTGNIIGRIIGCIISLSLYGFGIWIVYTVKEEIEHEERVTREVN